MSNRGCLVALLFYLSVIITAANDFDKSWYTYVDRVESVKAKRDVEQPATESPLDMATREFDETIEVLDNHIYYEIDYRHGTTYWMDIDSLGSPLVINQRLSDSNRHAVRVHLNFTYPFYGYDTKFLYVTSSGFLYVGYQSHKYLSVTQYVAPLMAGFDPSLHPDSTISYYGNDGMFVTEWSNLRLQKDPNGQNFTFQAAIFKNGTIVFSYKEKHVNISDIPSKEHPVKVGLADAYYHDTWIIPNVISRRVIYEYHSVELDLKKVDVSSTVVLTPLETCTDRVTCSTCTESPPPGFICSWCNRLNKCSDGFDRHRQAWLSLNCDKRNTTVCSERNPDEDGQTTVPSSAGSTSGSGKTDHKDNHDDMCPPTCGKGTCTSTGCVCPDEYYGRQCQTHKKNASSSLQRGSSHAAAVIFFLFLIIVIIVLSAWAFYAYKNPNTPSGLYLIKITRCYCLKRSGDSSSRSYRYEKTGAASI